MIFLLCTILFKRVILFVILLFWVSCCLGQDHSLHGEFVCLALSWQELVLLICKQRGCKTSLWNQIYVCVWVFLFANQASVSSHMTFYPVLNCSASSTISASQWSHRHQEMGPTGGGGRMWGAHREMVSIHVVFPVWQQSSVVQQGCRIKAVLQEGVEVLDNAETMGGGKH